VASLTAEYPVPGSPYQVAVEAPNRVWATLPAENAIVRLMVTSPGLYDVALFELPVTASEPYDIAFAAGRVWVTERSGNRIGSLDTVTFAWTEYPIPTADSQPTGIAVVAGNPIVVWFAERAGNKLGRLRVSDTNSATIDEFELPTGNAYPESVSATSSEKVWFSAPGISEIGYLNLSSWPGSPPAFASRSTGLGSQPRDIEVGADGLPWFTEPHGNRVGKFAPGTLTYFTWYDLPVSGSTPYGLDIAQGAIWFTEKDGSRVGQLQPWTRILREFALPDAAPTAIAVDATGCAWIAASNQDKIISWCAPYFQSAYLSLVRRG
jgi:streptogramin lyase